MWFFYTFCFETSCDPIAVGYEFSQMLVELKSYRFISFALPYAEPSTKLIMKKIVFLFALAILNSCGDEVQKATPQIISISESVYASGIVKSKNQYDAFLPVSGIINQIFVGEGDTIKKGDPILSVGNETQKLNRLNAERASSFASLESNTGKLNEAKQHVELARSRMQNDSSLYLRQKKLWDQQIGSKVDIESRELTLKNSKTLYLSSVVVYDDLKRQVRFNSSQAGTNRQIANSLEDDFILRSEIDGRVFQLQGEVGEVVNPQTSLAVIGDTENFILELQVDENDITNIKTGLPLFVTMDAYPNRVFDAVVTKINPLMNERSKSFLVEAEFIRGPEVLYPNISFEANIVIQTKDNALLIPRNYLINDSLVIKASGDTVAVRTGLKDYSRVEILSGISQSDELIKPE